MQTPPLLAMGRVFLGAALEIVPLFLVAILLGAVIEVFVSERVIARFLTGRNPGTMALAALIGALIPLCTCGMVPLAVSLRRRGGDVKHVFGFLTAGAAVSVPVLLLTWRLIGFGWLWIRLAGSVAMGLVVGYGSVIALRGVAARSARSPNPAPAPLERMETGDDPSIGIQPIRASRLASVLRRFAQDTREYAPWVLVSLMLAAAVDVLVPEHWIRVLYGQRTTVGSALGAVSGLPFYFCSGAELPLVRELLAKGMGPGPATAMMLAVPIVNVPTLGVVGKWLGAAGALRYLALCAGCAALIGIVRGLFPA